MEPIQINGHFWAIRFKQIVYGSPLVHCKDALPEESQLFPAIHVYKTVVPKLMGRDPPGNGKRMIPLSAL